MVGQLLNRRFPIYGGGLLIDNGAFANKICIYGYDSESFASNSAGGSVLSTWSVKSHLKAPLEAERVTWAIALIGGLACKSMTVLVSKSFAQGILARFFEGRVLHDAAESI